MQWRDTGHRFDLGHQLATQQSIKSVYRTKMTVETRFLLAGEGEGEGHSHPGERLIGQKSV